MKRLLYTVLLCCSLVAVKSQTVRDAYYNKVFSARFVEKPPLFLGGQDSLQRFYFNQFPAFDTVLSQAVRNGDTANYVRIYFSFVIDKNGVAYNPKFIRVAATTQYQSAMAKNLAYFKDDSALLTDAIRKMLYRMPTWKPALEHMIPVECEVEDYLQVWVGLQDPK